jgi:hypothetical protein
MGFPSKTEIVLVGAGALLGAGLVQAIHSLHAHPQKATFEVRLCCKNLAAAYAKISRDSGETVIERIDFSPGRSSCVASTLTLAGKRHEVEKFSVIDVVSEERIFEASCRRIQSQRCSAETEWMQQYESSGTPRFKMRWNRKRLPRVQLAEIWRDGQI